ncbi:MAG: shikimate dehydrogenase [Propionibacteriaceae bacterium]
MLNEVDPDDPHVAGRSCAVLGDPIEHSLSPAMHRAAYAEIGLQGWTYGRYRVDEAELADFLSICDERWRGLSLTRPLKVAALQAGEPDETSLLAGGANTLVFDDDGTRRLYNTDVEGLTRSLRAVTSQVLSHVLLIGGGATARSALVSASQLGCQAVTVCVRRAEQGEAMRPLAERLGIEVSVLRWDDALPTVDAAVSTVTAAAARTKALELAAAAPVIFDVVYDPWPTPLLQAAESAGAAVANGLDLLAHQAALQVELMTGHPIAAELLLSAGRAELKERARA